MADVIRGAASGSSTQQALWENFSLVEDSYQDDELTIPLKQLALNGAFPKGECDCCDSSISLFWMEAMEEVCRSGSSQPSLVVSWPGRMGVLQETPLVIIDESHTWPAIERPVQNMTAQRGKKQTLLFSAPTFEKIVNRMLPRL